MHEDDIKKINALYSNRYRDSNLAQHKKVGWGSVDSQNMRFQVLTEIGIKCSDTVIDVGCGLGDLYHYLNLNGIGPQFYTGVDVCQDFIDDCNKSISVENDKVQFLSGTLGSLDQEVRADYVLMSGALNLRLTENYAIAASTLKEMMKRANRGVAANFLSSYVDFSHEKDFHYSPEIIFKICKEITKNVVLRHNYPLYEFTVYLSP